MLNFFLIWIIPFILVHLLYVIKYKTIKYLYIKTEGKIDFFYMFLSYIPMIGVSVLVTLVLMWIIKKVCG